MISLTKQYIEKCGFEAGRTYSFDYYGGDELVLYTDFSYNLPEEGQEMVCTGSTAASDESVESACIVYADGSAGIFLSESCFKSEEMPTRFYVLGTDGSEYYDLALSRKIDIDDNFAYCDESFSLEELLGMNETEFERVFVRQSVEGGYKYVINDGRGRTEVTELSVANEKIATTDENMDMFGFKTGQSAAAFQTRCAQKNITLPEDRDYTSDTWVSFEYEDFIFRVIFSGGNISEIDVYADENHLDFDPEAQPGEETGEEDGEEGETETTSTRSSVSDGAYTITLHKSYLKAPGGTMAKANIVSKVSLTDVQARAVQPGDTINLSQYGYTDIKVDTAEFSGDEKLVVNGKYTFVKKGNVWNYVGSSGSAYTYKTGTGDFYFPEGLEITDYTSGTEKTLTDIRDFSGSELNTVSVVVSDGKVTKAIISYKP